MGKFELNKKGLRDLQKKIESDINAQQKRNPIRESDSQAEQDRKISKWIKDAGYGKR